jgi:sRNA-binding carbon storage regulator CsrA
MSEPLSTLIVDVRPGERLSISAGSEVSIELVKKSGQLARLRVSAPRDVKIERQEVVESRCKHG